MSYDDVLKQIEMARNVTPTELAYLMQIPKSTAGTYLKKLLEKRILAKKKGHYYLRKNGFKELPKAKEPPQVSATIDKPKSKSQEIPILSPGGDMNPAELFLHIGNQEKIIAALEDEIRTMKREIKAFLWDMSHGIKSALTELEKLLK